MEGKWSVSRPSRFIIEVKVSVTFRVIGLACPRFGLGAVRMRKNVSSLSGI